MPSLILDDFFGDIKIELQLAHIADVDVKNSEMVNQVFCKMKSMEKEIKKLKNERDFFNQEVHKTLEHQADCETEIKKITSHRDRLLRFHKRNTKKIKEMEIEIKNWKITIEKKSNENTDLRFLNRRLLERREENESLKERNGKKLKSPDTDYKLLFSVGATNLSRASYDKEFAECAKLFMRGHFNSYEGWINYRYYE